MPYMIYVTLDNDHVENIVEFLRQEMHVRHVIIVNGAEYKMKIISFRVSDHRLSEVVDELSGKGVGVDFGIIDVVAIVATKPYLSGEPDEVKEKAGKKQSFSTRKLLTEFVYSQVYAQSNLTTDFILYVLVGGFLATFGLATDNAVTIVASMLVSPLMGPILGMTLGTIVRSTKLIRKSVICEFVGVLTVFLTGCIMGIIFSFFGGARGLAFPTAQMSERGEVEGLIFGAGIAFASGIGVALSVAYGSVNSLVGVAISAALLPPIANSGILFTYGLLAQSMPQVSWRREVPDYEVLSRGKYMIMSAISMGMFIINLLFIYLTGLLIFRLKEFAPMNENTTSWSDFKHMNKKQMEQMEQANEGEIIGQDALSRSISLDSRMNKIWHASPLVNHISRSVSIPARLGTSSTSNIDNASVIDDDTIVLNTPRKTSRVHFGANVTVV